MLLVNNSMLPNDLYEVAKKNRVNVIRVPMGTYKTANMVKLCNYFKLLNVNTNPVSFNVFDYRNDFLEVSNKLGHTNYPIINKKNICLGMMRLVDANNFDRKKVILVDHNQQSQSVDGIDEAEILEVIDHHNLGTIGTSMPINFRCMPVGCTCTIIYKLYQEAGVKIPKDIAGIMLSAILSDTLLFKSPTTTALDIEIGEELAKIAGLDVQTYGTKMFKAASSVAGLSVEEIINTDIKTFKYGDSNMAIGQVITMDFDELLERILLLSEVSELKKVSSYIYENSAMVMAEFNLGVNVNDKSSEIKNKLDSLIAIAKMQKYFQCNPVRWIDLMYNIELLDAQALAIQRSWFVPNVLMTCTRGFGKSTIIDLELMAKDSLFCNYWSYIASGTGSQAEQTFGVLEKLANDSIDTFAGSTGKIFKDEIVINNASGDGFSHNPNGFNFKTYKLKRLKFFGR